MRASALVLAALSVAACTPSPGTVHTDDGGADAGGGSGGGVGGGAGGGGGGGVDSGAPDSGAGDSGVDAGLDAGIDAGPTGPFYPIKEPDSLAQVSGLFTTGGQYVDPGNGVLADSWSMLVRWQGATFVDQPVSYDLGQYTGLHVPAPYATWQRGPQPEDADAGSPGVQLNGYRAGLQISTWQVPHRFIEGGGYNDMYGYAWSAPNRPLAFPQNGDLVLQSDFAVPTFRSWANTGSAWVEAAPGATGQYADGQLALFAYLEDTAHPALHPIAFVALAWGNRATGGCPTTGFAGFDYPGGVWFGSAGICTTDISTVIYSAPTQSATFAQEQFFRIHITTQNWLALIARLNSAGPANPDGALRCTPGSTCPQNGYSTNVADYRLQYFGAIAEVVLLENGAPNNTSTIRQVMMGANIHGVGAYSYRP